MKDTFKGFTPQVKREIEAITERQEINDIVNASFTNDEKRAFNTLLICVCSVLVVVPTIILSI